MRGRPASACNRSTRSLSHKRPNVLGKTGVPFHNNRKCLISLGGNPGMGVAIGRGVTNATQTTEARMYQGSVSGIVLAHGRTARATELMAQDEWAYTEQADLDSCPPVVIEEVAGVLVAGADGRNELRD